MYGWVGGWVDGWMGGWVDGWMDGWVGGWMGGWMEIWMGGWVDGWLDRLMNACVVMDGLLQHLKLLSYFVNKTGGLLKVIIAERSQHFT